MAALTCQGCDGVASQFQCPLCQAEGSKENGFFCTQTCFATNWLAHRNSFHKKGVAREIKKDSAKEPGETKSADTRKRAREAPAAAATPAEEEEEEGEVRLHYPPWHPLPSATECQKNKWAQVDPALDKSCPRAIVSTTVGDEQYALWPAAVAAAVHIAPQLRQDPALQVLVVAGSAPTAHAFAWAARSCGGLTGHLRLAVTTADEALATPSSWFTAQRRVMVVTHAVLQHTGGVASAWLTTAKSLLVTLPDVPTADAVQGVDTRAVFFVSADKSDTGSAWAAEEKATHTLSLMAPAALYGEDAALDPAQLLQIQESDALRFYPVGYTPEAAERERELAGPPPRLDNDLATAIANGDTGAVVQHVARIYSHAPGCTEEVLRHALRCDWGALSVTHLQHRLAHLLRALCDQSSHFESSGTKATSLADVALRTIAYLSHVAPPIAVEEEETAPPAAAAPAAKQKAGSSQKGAKRNKTEAKATAAAAAVGPRMPTIRTTEVSAADKKKYKNYYSQAADLQLQATLCYIFPLAPLSLVDALGTAWGLTRCLAGLAALRPVLKATGATYRQDAIARLESRYGAKQSPAYANYLSVLMLLCYDAVAIYSLSLEEMERRLLWSLTVGPDVDDLRQFLANCFLLPEAVLDVKKGKKKAAAVTSRQVQVASPAMLLYDAHEVKAPRPRSTTSRATQPEFVELPWKSIPLSGERRRQHEKLREIAVTEILMAMPPQPRPMFIGELGNLIGKWSAFNARFDGALGISLSTFLESQKEHFTLVGTLVTRKKAGKTEQVRLHFNNDHDEDDSDNEDGGRKARDRKALTGGKTGSGGREIGRRAQKKNIVKEFNRSRFNKNHKPFDPSARVPGYVKHGARRITGRGKKANKRNYKRSS